MFDTQNTINYINQIFINLIVYYNLIINKIFIVLFIKDLILKYSNKIMYYKL